MNNHGNDGRLSYSPSERARALMARYSALSPQRRGIIVVDTCSLFSLAGEAQQGKHYFDILTFLSEHGYKILIPDMVAFEASQALPNGSNVGKYFQRKDNRYHSALVKFIEDVAKKKYPNIYITSTPEPTEIRNFIDKLVEITRLPPSNPKARKLIMDHQDKNHNRRNWGDKAIQELVQDIQNTFQSQIPVHVLTQDYRFLSDIGYSMPELNVLTAFGLLLAVVESGLCQAIPFLDHSANANDLLTACNQSLTRQGRAGWASKNVLDGSMKVLLARPPVPHDIPMMLSATHTARFLGYGMPEQTHSIIVADIPTEDENENERLHKLRKQRAEKRSNLKGGIGNNGNGGWLNL